MTPHQFSIKIGELNQAVFIGTVAEMKTSIVEGSTITGSQGQPVDTGNLRDSWQVEFITPESALISTNVVYAPMNEYGVTDDGRPYTQKSALGGRHSVALTLAGAQAVVDSVAKGLAV